MKFLTRIFLPFLFSGVIGLWLYFKLITEHEPFKKDEVTNYIFIIVLSIAVLIGGINSYFFTRRCKSCKEWNALKVISKEVVDERPSHKIKKLTEKNSKGEVIKTREVTVPSTVYTFLIHKKCEFCEQVTEYTKIKNIEN
jgi:hypothetical protein